MNELNLKFIFLGDSSVGKTSIVEKYTEKKFRDTHQTTLGIDFKISIITLKGHKIKITISDTAGQERFRSIATNYIKNSDGIFIVFDLSNKSSFESISYWINEINKVKNLDELKIIILGNKNDLTNIREISKEEISEFIKTNNYKIIETSAKTGEGIKEAFEDLVDLIFENKTEDEIYNLYCPNYDKRRLLDKQNNENSNAQCC